MLIQNEQASHNVCHNITCTVGLLLSPLLGNLGSDLGKVPYLSKCNLYGNNQAKAQIHAHSQMPLVILESDLISDLTLERLFFPTIVSLPYFFSLLR